MVWGQKSKRLFIFTPSAEGGEESKESSKERVRSTWHQLATPGPEREGSLAGYWQNERGSGGGARLLKFSKRYGGLATEREQEERERERELEW